jgi:hypothetical protein
MRDPRAQGLGLVVLGRRRMMMVCIVMTSSPAWMVAAGWGLGWVAVVMEGEGGGAVELPTLPPLRAGPCAAPWVSRPK